MVGKIFVTLVSMIFCWQIASANGSIGIHHRNLESRDHNDRYLVLEQADYLRLLARLSVRKEAKIPGQNRFATKSNGLIIRMKDGRIIIPFKKI